jgi:hypothetical protein
MPMFSLIHDLGPRAAARYELIPFVLAFGIAELFYKFGSFSLELVAFIGTWLALSAVQRLIVK